MVNEWVAKTDRHDAATSAECLENGMPPTARLCSRESEEMRRLPKVRSSLATRIVGVKNQIRGLQIGLGIESTRRELQS